ncbi:hypothetical protein ASD48_28535 [Streptomyces sp. Root1310]|nr:hypothetical protein ASD48_28535 [Streptomyces sp. Root1310]
MTRVAVRHLSVLRSGDTTLSPEDAPATAMVHRADVAGLDLWMPGTGGVNVATSLRVELPGCRAPIVTRHGRPGHLERALAACVRGFAAGARDSRPVCGGSSRRR